MWWIFWRNICKKIVLYHGSPNRIIIPTYGLDEDRHDYGKGFYELSLEGLSVYDYSEHNILCWLAELMKHRAADDSKRYRVWHGF